MTTMLAMDPKWLLSRHALRRHYPEAYAPLQTGAFAPREQAAAMVEADTPERGGVDAKDRIGPLGELVEDVAVINVEGPLSFGQSIFTELGCGVCYGDLVETFAAAAADARVERVLLDLDTPGGMVSGVTAAAESLASLGLVKPVTALVNEMACSAGYWIASQATEIVATPTANVGSIGAICVMYDESAKFEKNGVRPVVVTTASLKRGFPGEVIDDELAQHELDGLGEAGRLIVGAVSAGREIRTDEIEGWQGRVFVGAQGVAAGLVDRIVQPETLYAELLRA